MGFLTPLWLVVRAFLSTNGILAALLIGGGILAVTYDQSRVRAGRIIEAKEREASNAKAVDIARRGAAGSGSKRVLDPYTRSE